MSWVQSLVLQHFGGRRAFWSSGMGTGQVTNGSIIHTDLDKPNNKLVSAQLEHFWCMDEALAPTYSQDSLWLGLGGNHHPYPPPSPLQYFLCLVIGLHPNAILSQDSQLGSPKILEIRTPATLEAHDVLFRTPIEVRYEAKLQPSSRAFQKYVACHLHISKLGRFLIFNA